MKKSDLVAMLTCCAEGGRDGMFNQVAGWLSVHMSKGDKDAKKILAAMAERDGYLKKYLAKGL